MILAILLMVLGVVGILLGGAMFGDIGVAAIIGGGAALLSGLGIFRLEKRVSVLQDSKKPE